MTDALELELRTAMTERAQNPQIDDVVERLQHLDYPKSRRRMLQARLGLLPVLGGAGAALAAAIATVIVLLSSGAPAAYAGWASVPTRLSATELSTAVNKCYMVGAKDIQLTLPAPGGTTQPVLAEARGRSAAAVYAVAGRVYLCLDENGSMYTTVDSDSMGPLRVAPGPDQLSIPYGVYGGGGMSTPTQHLTPQQRLKRQISIARQGARTALINGGGYFALGQAGSDVSAVTFSFTNGKTVSASVQNGWYFAWWPWRSDPTSVAVTTSTGTTTSPMGASPHDGRGSRPYPACEPESNGCVFAAKQPPAPATPTTSTGTTITPTTSTPTAAVLATATQECHAFTLTYQVMSADAFTGAPVLTQIHGSSVGLLNLTGGRVNVCLVGGNQNNLHAFFAWHLGNYGRVRNTPGADQLSVPYAEDNGAGGGRVAPSLEGEPAALRHRRPGSMAYTEYMQAGGYGPYALGQAGSDVSGVSFAFANGKTADAAVSNGWYFAWWPWTSAPTSVTVTTSSGTTTSPVTGTHSQSVPVIPGCQPGSKGCVFVKNPPEPSTPTPPTTVTAGTTNPAPTTPTP